MDTTETTDFPVKALLERYQIGRTWLYERYMPALQLAGLGTPIKKKNQSFLNAEQLKFLDGYDIASKNNEIDEFLSQRGISTDRKQSTEQSDSLTVFRQAVEMTHLLKPVLSPSPPPDLLYPQRVLAEAAEHGWQLSSHQLCRLLDRKRLPGNELKWCGFVLIRRGISGPDCGWAISKEVG